MEPNAPSADFTTLLTRLQLRLGTPLPPSLIGFWELRARSPQWGTLFDTLMSPKMFAPSAYLDGHGYGPEYRLSVARVDSSIRPVHETLDYGYQAWFDGAAEALRATAATWRSFEVGDSVMLDPAVARSLIQIASDHGEWVELVSDWCDHTGESPIFRAGDDHEGYVDLLGTSLPSGSAWRSTRRWHGSSHRISSLPWQAGQACSARHEPCTRLSVVALAGEAPFRRGIKLLGPAPNPEPGYSYTHTR
ncbi:hypothetical protein [Streptomyces sp. NPDC001787]|uniref:hypothetical protein n=1 Tax=Streptomyces sp. NPDC001787 TaxID=3154523 RepID=UPI00332F29FB